MILYQNGSNEVQKVPATLELKKAFAGSGLPFRVQGWCGVGAFELSYRGEQQDFVSARRVDSPGGKRKYKNS